MKHIVCALLATALVTESAYVRQSGPPKDPAATRAADLVELVKLDPTIKLDIRYSTTNNLTGKRVYP
jgi:D-alanyl-D-alanine dipeptidase